MFVEQGSLAVTNCVFVTNGCRTDGLAAGVPTLSGGAIDAPVLRMADSTLRGNVCRTSSSYSYAKAFGAGIRVGTLEAVRLVVIGNWVDISNDSASLNQAQGGGIWCGDNSAMRNCLVAGNSVTLTKYGSSDYHSEGAGLYLAGTNTALANCTIVGNGGEGVRLTVSGYDIVNSILWGNGTPIFYKSLSSQYSVSYSTVQFGQTGQGNLSTDPLFEPGDEFYHLRPASPCVDAGNPGLAYIDAFLPPSQGKARNDMGAYGGPEAGVSDLPAVDTDHDGLPDSWETQYLQGLAFGPDDDPDGDKLSNSAELPLGTDPSKRDTDGDGFTDRTEVNIHSNPLDPKSTPPPSMKVTVKQVEIEFTPASGRTYEVHGSADLRTWATVDSVVGTGEAMQRVYNVTNEVRFFRLVSP